jgi:hypothetical protein
MTEVLRNLVIVHTPGQQALSDWTTIKATIEARAPDIEVRIVDNNMPGSATRRWQARRPSLVFSPSPLLDYKPPGGRVYEGRRLNKLEQFEQLARAGVPTPDSVLLRDGVRLDPARWGEIVIVKPTGRWSSYGRFVRLVRTETVAARYRELSDDGRVEAMVQQYVDAVDEQGRGFEVRVLTLFGRPLYALKALEDLSRPPVDEAADGDGLIALNRRGVKRTLSLEADDDMLELARRTAAAVPEVPCIGIDIVRDRRTGQALVLETNGAAVWHLSSASTANYPKEIQAGLYTQFDALAAAADALIERTRAEAA